METRIPWTRSLTVRISAALVFLFVLAAGSVGLTVYELNLRKHDYVILNLTGQLRVIARTVVRQAEQFREAGDHENFTPEQRAELFRNGFAVEMAQYDKIIAALKARELPADITGRHDPLRCNWDSQSIAQLNRTAITWEDFRAGLMQAAGDASSGPDLGAVSAYVAANEERLKAISDKLATSFQHMMEGKMALIVRLNQGELGAFLVVVALLLWLLHRSFVAPLKATLRGMARVAQGDFAHQIPVHHADELGNMAEAFNHVAERMAGLFRLTERINESTTLEATLRAVFDDFRELLPLDWLGLLSLRHDGSSFVLERLYCRDRTTLNEGDGFAAEGSVLAEALAGGRPLHIADMAATVESNPRAEFAARLLVDGRHSVLFFPLASGKRHDTVLAFAHRQAEAYTKEHLELLGNIAGQISHGFDKTVVTENLIVSAVSGLAKLAESRDPETGDHLIRMALYAAILAEDMNGSGPHQGRLPPDRVRDIHRFAPMHDIGKVGIEDRILLKPGRLTPEERTNMERHPLIGAEVLRRCEEQMNAVGHSVFRTGIEIAEAHHEKYDGSGYPHGIAGDAIPLSARIVAVADVFDALTSKRPYKEAWPVEKALTVMTEDAGKHFDPEVIAAMHRALPRMLDVYERLKHV